jgi:hypothetical protein
MTPRLLSVHPDPDHAARSADRWRDWCEEREIRMRAVRLAIRRSDLTPAQIKRRYGLINCGHCGERHR